MNAETEEENEDVSVCARYSKYPHWNSVLETQFLEDLVSCYPNTSGLDLELYFETDLDDGVGESRPFLQTPTWSLSLLEGDSITPVKPVIIPIVQSSKKNRKRSGHCLSNRKLVKTSHYFNHEDWSELFLMQDLSGERFRYHYSSPDLSTDSSSDETSDGEHFEADNIEIEDTLEQTETAEAPSKAPVRDAIRRRVEEATDKDRRLLKFKHEKDTWKKYYRPKKESLMELPVISREDAISFCSVVNLLDNPQNIMRHFQHANLLKTQRKQEKKKRVFLYEQKPFKDPILEAKRLKCLYQKIYDDKKKFNYEILQVENRDLRDENMRLRDQIQRLLLGNKRKLSGRVPGSCSDHTVSESEGSLSDPAESLIGRRKRGI